MSVGRIEGNEGVPLAASVDAQEKPTTLTGKLFAKLEARLLSSDKVAAELNIPGMPDKKTLKYGGLHLLGAFLDLLAINLVVSGVANIIAGVGLIPFFGSGVAGIVIGSVIIAAGLGVGVAGVSVHMAAERYRKKGSTAEV